MTDTTTSVTDTIHIPQQPTPSSLRCRHIVDGRRCGSPAMRGERFCYHHHQTRRPVAALRQRRARQSTFSVPAPESRHQIQQAIGDVMLRIAGNDIDLRRAGLLLYALQLATCNLNEHQRQNARTAAPDNHPAEPAYSAPVEQQSHEAEAQSPEQGRQPQAQQPPAPSHSKAVAQQQPANPHVPTEEKKCHPEQSAKVPGELARWGGAESKDLRFTTTEPPAPHSSEPIHYGSGRTPDLASPQTHRAPSTDFTPPAPVWHKLSNSIGATLLHRYFHPELYDDPLE
jgi:hypothetical protein